MTLPDDRPAVTGVSEAEVEAAYLKFWAVAPFAPWSDNEWRGAMRAALEAAAHVRTEQDGEVERKLDDTRADLALANEELFFLRAGAEDDRFAITDLRAALAKAGERVKALEAGLASFAKAGELFGPRLSDDYDQMIYSPAAGPEYALCGDDLRRAAALLADPTTAGAGTMEDRAFKPGDRVRWYHLPLCEGRVLKNNGGLCKVQWDTGEVRRDTPDKLRSAEIGEE